MKTSFSLLMFLLSLALIAQENNHTEQEISISEIIDGSLITPNTSEKPALAIIIAGSGPTDRNGNQNFLKNNTLKKLATALAEHNIATFRYDKRIVKQIKTGSVNVKDMRFDDFVTDAKSVISYFKESEAYSKLYVIGHSQGSLVGMLAAENTVDGFISLAGAGQNIGNVIVDQINNTARQYVDDTKRVVDTLKAGNTTEDFPPALAAMFNLETQPFMISWMAHEPTKIIKSLNIPVLIVNGTKDLQVPVEEAKLLVNANTASTLKIVENMNHVLFTIEGDNLENSKSYNESFRPINPELITTIVDFIKNN